MLAIFSIIGLLLVGCFGDDPADEMIEVEEYGFDQNYDFVRKRVVKVGDFNWYEGVNDKGNYWALTKGIERRSVKINTFDLNGAKAVKKYLDNK